MGLIFIGTAGGAFAGKFQYVAIKLPSGEASFLEQDLIALAPLCSSGKLSRNRGMNSRTGGPNLWFGALGRIFQIS